MSSDHPDWLPEPEADEGAPFEGDPKALVQDIQERFLYHWWVVARPNPYFNPQDRTNG